MGKKVIISIFHLAGLRGVDVQLDGWGEDDGPTQECDLPFSFHLDKKKGSFLFPHYSNPVFSECFMESPVLWDVRQKEY